MSDWSQVKSDVPQVSVLCPLLFILLINDIIDEISGTIIKFADDKMLFKVGKKRILII